MQTRNHKHNGAGGVDMEILHPDYGWIPFSAHPGDTEKLGRGLHAEAMAGTLGAVAAYAPTAAEIKTATNTPILAQIAAVEVKQDRALREAVLGKPGAAARLDKIETDIAVLRATLLP